MPQYRALRVKHSLWEMFHTPSLAAEVTCQPLEHLNVDAAIVFSDILVIAEALGLNVHFPEQGGPRIEPQVTTTEAVAALPHIPESLSYVFETIRQVKQRISVPLIGFSGGPFTVATYLTQNLRFSHALLSKITEATIVYLQNQIRAGVDAVQIFDSWANLLDDGQFAEFSLFYLKQIVDALRPSGIPVILFCRDSSLRAEKLAAIGPTAISFDWHLPMEVLRSQVPASIAVQGNINPEILKLPKDAIAEEVKALLASMEGEKGFIVNLGHGVTQDTPFENVRYFVDLVKNGAFS